MARRMVFVLHAHMPYVLNHGEWPHGADWLLEATLDCYLPLLATLDRLENDGIQSRWTVGITPILAEQWADPSFPQRLEAHAEAKLGHAKDDAERFVDQGQHGQAGIAETWRRWHGESLRQFREQWSRDLTGAFAKMQEQGQIELMASAATHAYLPLLADDRSVRAQVQIGLESHHARFGKPRAFWLPECGHRPSGTWAPPVGPPRNAIYRKGTDQILSEQSIAASFVDSHLVRGGQPGPSSRLGERRVGRAPLLVAERAGLSSPIRTPSNLSLFMRDRATAERVWSADEGFPGDPRYMEFHKRQPPGRLRYWRVTSRDSHLDAKEPYESNPAFKAMLDHAAEFVDLAHRSTPEGSPSCSMYDAELFGHWWREGPAFLEQAARLIHQHSDLECITASEALDQAAPSGPLALPEGSWGEGGDHRVWLNGFTEGIWTDLHKAEREMIELAQGPESEAALQAARELLVAQSSDWTFCISTGSAPDYAHERIEDHISRFRALAAMARQGDIDESFLRECQQRTSIYPNLSLDAWR